jgi:hypothetical protein
MLLLILLIGVEIIGLGKHETIEYVKTRLGLDCNNNIIKRQNQNSLKVHTNNQKD